MSYTHSMNRGEVDMTPPERNEPERCDQCEHWEPCPDGCGWGYCTWNKDFAWKGDNC